jgi:hypothetical protein
MSGGFDAGRDSPPERPRESPVTSRGAEVASLAAIALAILLGGNSLLNQIARSPFHGIAIVLLAGIGFALVLAMRRSIAAGGELARLRASRDIAFIASLAAAIAFIALPARWSFGACIAALEFGLVLEIISRLAPGRAGGSA